uniref:HSP70-like protein n=1 Tax=Little cherry virus 1 TaxID=217686 RepID=A0A097ZRZ0_9CLOS|nr:HSP70-like protein [Little cherry virus 1]
MSVKVGIDFGTTFSTISGFVNGSFLSLLVDKSPFIPSVLAIFDGNNIVLGEQAKVIHRLSSNYVKYFDLKRWVGVSEKNFLKLKDKISPKYDCFFKVNDCYISGLGTSKRELPIRSLIYWYLKILINLFEDQHKLKISEVNISVPADYTTRQRIYMRSIVDLLGIPVRRIINEPSAAAMHQLFINRKENDFVVYDFGGGTFDVSYIKKRGKIISIIDTAGDLFLGGRDIDRSLAKYITQKTGHSCDDLFINHLKESVTPGVSRNYKFIDDLGNLQSIDINLDDINSIAKPYIDRSLELLDSIIKRNNISKALVCMVGGTSLLAGTHNAVVKFCESRDLRVFRSEHLRSSVAYGCAILHEFDSDKEFIYIDVNSHGLLDVGHHFIPRIIMRKPLSIPYSISFERSNDTKFLTAACVYEGDSLNFIEDDLLVNASFMTDEVSDLGSGYKLTYSYDIEGKLSVSISSLDNAKVKVLKNIIDSKFELIKLDLVQTQLSSSAIYSVIVSLSKYWGISPELNHLTIEFPYLIKDFIDKNGGLDKYVERIRNEIGDFR